jgi:hypothetical protein
VNVYYKQTPPSPSHTYRKQLDILILVPHSVFVSRFSFSVSLIVTMSTKSQAEFPIICMTRISMGSFINYNDLMKEIMAIIY